MYGGVYIRTYIYCRHSQFPPACPPFCQLHPGVGWTPPSAACREGTRRSCYTYVRTCIRYTHTHKLQHCDTAIVSHLVILLSDSLSLMDCLCSSSTLACRSVNSSLVCRSCPCSAYVRTGRQHVRTYVHTYIVVHIHS